MDFHTEQTQLLPGNKGQNEIKGEFKSWLRLAQGILGLLIGLFFICHLGSHMIAKDSPSKPPTTHQPRATQPLLRPSSLLKFNESSSRSSDQVQWGNPIALEQCFGKDYKKAGDAISHCFLEGDTHNTCCMMDKWTRDTNDEQGNPIGAASLAAARAIAGTNLDDTDDLLTPWCTCFGSQVCSAYASGEIAKKKNKPVEEIKTVVKFVNDCGCAGGTPGKGFCMGNIPKDQIFECEGWARAQFNMKGHATPGVDKPPDGATCPALQGKPEVDVNQCTETSEHPAAAAGPVSEEKPKCAHLGVAFKIEGINLDDMTSLQQSKLRSQMRTYVLSTTGLEPYAKDGHPQVIVNLEQGSVKVDAILNVKPDKKDEVQAKAKGVEAEKIKSIVQALPEIQDMQGLDKISVGEPVVKDVSDAEAEKLEKEEKKNENAKTKSDGSSLGPGLLVLMAFIGS